MKPLTTWSEDKQDLVWACLRAYLGFSLVARGYVYFMHIDPLVELMTSHHVPFASNQLAQIVAVTHVAGGLLLTFGWMTRLAAAIQIPNVVGAILFVHLQEGFFGASQALGHALLVLVVLGAFVANGGGSWSVEGSLRPPKGRPEARPIADVESDATHAAHATEASPATRR